MVNSIFRPYSEINNLNWRQKKRLELYDFIYNPNSCLSKGCSLFITIVIVIAITSSCLETIKIFHDLLIFKIIEFICSLIFMIEYILKFCVITNHNKYLKTCAHFIDFVSIIPIFFIFSINNNDFSGIFSFLKILKLLRIVKVLSNKSTSIYSNLLLETMIKSIYGLKLMVILIVIIMIFSSSIIYELEKGVRVDGSEPFSSIPVTFYWSIVTITTVGYGDIYPITDLGRFVSCLTMIMGLIIIALPITIISKNFSRTWDEFENRGLIKIKNKCLETVKCTDSNNLHQ